MKHAYLSLLFPMMIACGSKTDGIQSLSVDELAIEVSANENREYSYTDKKAGFWYGRTHQDTPIDWYAGWNQAKKRLVSDYSLYVDGKQMLRKDAKVTVSPESLTRQWNQVTEKLQLVDNMPLLSIALTAPESDSIAIELNTTLLKSMTPQGNAILCVPAESPDEIIKLVPMNDEAIKVENNQLKTLAKAGGFILA